MSILNNIKNVILSIIITFGSIYTFSLGSANGTIMAIKRYLVIIFILLEFLNILIRRNPKMLKFILLIALNIFFSLILFFVNSKWTEVFYQIISLIFIATIQTHFYRYTYIAKLDFINILSIFFKILFTFFLLLILVYYVFDIGYVKDLLVRGFGNDYSNFSVWLGSLSLLLTLLVIHFEFNVNTYYIYQFILLILIFLSGGRTGGILVIGGFFLFVNNKYKFSGKILSITFITLIILLIGFFSKDLALFNRFNYDSGSLDQDALDKYSSGRITLVLGAFDALKTFKLQDYIFGYGINNFFFEYQGEDYQIHNLFVKTLIETGVVGFILLIILYFKPLFTSYQNNRNMLVKSLYLIASINAFVSPSSFYTNLNVFASIWVVIALSQNDKTFLS